MSTRPATPLSLPFIGISLLLALILLVGGNSLLFLAYYKETFSPVTLPYTENFATTQRLDYRQFGGDWQLRDNRLVQSNTQNTDLMAVMPLILAADQSYQFGVHIQILQGPNGGGLLFNLQQKDSRQQSHLVRFGNDNGRDYLVFGYFDENLQFVAQGSLAPPDLTGGVELAVQVHEATYDVLVNGQPQQQAIPLQYSGGRLALTTWFSSVAFDDIYVNALDVATTTLTQAATSSPVRASAPVTTSAPAITNSAIASTAVSAAPPVAENLFFTEQFGADTDQTQWTTLSGDWRFETGALVQANPEGFDHSIIRDGTFARYTLDVRLRHRAGVGGGLLFNMPVDKTETGGHMVRYFADGSLVWGYFTEDNVFNGQGYQPVALPGDQAHTLQVVVGDSTYAIRLDNQLIVENVALVNPQGRIGLTASQSVVAFEEIMIAPIE